MGIFVTMFFPRCFLADPVLNAADEAARIRQKFLDALEADDELPWRRFTKNAIDGKI